ncbi:MAG: alpha-amylase [Bacteroidia bacterium]
MKRTMSIKMKLWALVAILFTFQSCKTESAETSSNETEVSNEENPMENVEQNIDWVRNAVIYEVNTRQYTPEGTFAAFEKKLPQLKELGVDILWFMPIHPIGLKNRKETEESLGSYYSVRDYKAVNPDLGTVEEFKSLVATCHEMGFKVVLDWVANHTAPDHAWVEEHPEFYTRDAKGNYPVPPEGTDWWDVADLDYSNQEMRNEMISALKYWVDECDIDGYRCDMAGMVPLDFWLQARPQIEENKKLFMLAEWQDARFYEAFDFIYGWPLKNVFVELTEGESNVESLVKMSCEDNARWLLHDLDFDTWGPYNLSMNFVTNHDENSWEGTAIERWGSANKAFATLTFLAPGLPLIYSGQEVGNNKRLLFFEKDLFDWSDNDGYFDFYKDLVKMKHENTALAVGTNGGSFESFKIENEHVYAFFREGSDDALIAFFNMSNDAQTFALPEFGHLNNFEMNAGDELTLEAWEYKVETIKTMPDDK